MRRSRPEGLQECRECLFRPTGTHAAASGPTNRGGFLADHDVERTHLRDLPFPLDLATLWPPRPFFVCERSELFRRLAVHFGKMGGFT